MGPAPKRPITSSRAADKLVVVATLSLGSFDASISCLKHASTNNGEAVAKVSLIRARYVAICASSGATAIRF
jgi:hypothetical protein